MFERYTEKARRVISFARFEASQFGSPYIETDHMLLGLLQPVAGRQGANQPPFTVACRGGVDSEADRGAYDDSGEDIHQCGLATIGRMQTLNGLCGGRGRAAWP